MPADLFILWQRNIDICSQKIFTTSWQQYYKPCGSGSCHIVAQTFDICSQQYFYDLVAADFCHQLPRDSRVLPSRGSRIFPYRGRRFLNLVAADFNMFWQQTFDRTPLKLKPIFMCDFCFRQDDLNFY